MLAVINNDMYCTQLSDRASLTQGCVTMEDRVRLTVLCAVRVQTTHDDDVHCVCAVVDDRNAEL
jgi:hypothetical protein